jgi:lipopolysaccharide export system ATP-binding protein
VFFDQQEIVGILGPNGSGKTTLFSILAGIIPPDSGTIMLNNKNLTKLSIHQRAKNGLVYLPQDASIFRGLSVENNIKAVLELKIKSKTLINETLNELLDMFSIEHVRKSKAISLSGGERRKVEIARALAASPTFLMLDEPFSGIDPISVNDIMDIVRNLNKIGIGIIITDHNVRETLAILHRGYVLVSGEILFHGTTDEILQNKESRELYLGEYFVI